MAYDFDVEKSNADCLFNMTETKEENQKRYMERAKEHYAANKDKSMGDHMTKLIGEVVKTIDKNKDNL